jgi:hypothetical protein
MLLSSRDEAEALGLLIGETLKEVPAPIVVPISPEMLVCGILHSTRELEARPINLRKVGKYSFSILALQSGLGPELSDWSEDVARFLPSLRDLRSRILFGGSMIRDASKIKGEVIMALVS